MAAAVSNVTQIPLLNIQQSFFSQDFTPLAAPNTVAHGMTLADGTTGIAPTVILVFALDATAVLSSISATATDILFTSTTTGDVTIFAF